MKRHEISASGRGPQWLVDLVRNLRLSWRLLRDPFVPIGFKFIPIAALLYVLFPVDLIPDLVLGLGQLDDLTVMLLGIKLFIDVCPPSIVEKHLAQMSSYEGSFRVVSDEPAQAGDVAEHTGLLEEKSSSVSNQSRAEPDKSA